LKKKFEIGRNSLHLCSPLRRSSCFKKVERGLGKGFKLFLRFFLELRKILFTFAIALRKSTDKEDQKVR